MVKVKTTFGDYRILTESGHDYVFVGSNAIEVVNPADIELFSRFPERFIVEDGLNKVEEKPVKRTSYPGKRK